MERDSNHRREPQCEVSWSVRKYSESDAEHGRACQRQPVFHARLRNGKPHRARHGSAHVISASDTGTIHRETATQ